MGRSHYPEETSPSHWINPSAEQEKVSFGTVKSCRKSVSTLDYKTVISVACSFRCAHKNLMVVGLDISECKEMPED